MTEAIAPDVVDIYQNKRNQWYWRRTAANNRIISIGGEGYDNQDDAESMARSVNSARDGVEPTFTITPNE